MTNWQYIGDISPKYGGAWFDTSEIEYGYVTAVRVTECPPDFLPGGVWVERCTICGFDNADVVESALRCVGWSEDYAQGVEPSPLCLADALLSYGHYDVEESETLQCEWDGPMRGPDGHKAHKRVTGDNLDGYIKAVWLD